MTSDAFSDAFLNALAEVVGGRHVLTDADVVAPYLTDERNRFTGSALAVVSPGSTDEVAAIVKLCAARGVAVVPQGGNTSLCGGATPLAARATTSTPLPPSPPSPPKSTSSPSSAAASAPPLPPDLPSGRSVVLSLRRMRGVRSLDRLSRTITVGAGTTVAEVAAAAAEVDLLFPLSFGAEASAQIGGALSTNAGGTAVLRYGHARALALGLEVVLANGEVLRLGRGLRKDNAGYDLKHLFIGSEGTLGVICEATLALYPMPRSRVTCVASVAGPREALKVLGRLQDASGGRVTACEWMSPTTRRLACEMPGGARDPFGAAQSNPADPSAQESPPSDKPHSEVYRDAYAPHLKSLVLYELTSSDAGSELEAALEETLASALENGLIGDAAIADSSAATAALWRLRTAPSEAEKRVGVSIKHDISVLPERIDDFLAKSVPAVQRIMEGVRINAFGHLGDGNVHFNLLPPEGADFSEFLAAEEELTAAVFTATDALGGSFSAEHGIGQLRRGDLERWRPTELALMRRLKTALDPYGVFNPGKVV